MAYSEMDVAYKSYLALASVAYATNPPLKAAQEALEKHLQRKASRGA
jgi:hypothetical protein